MGAMLPQSDLTAAFDELPVGIVIMDAESRVVFYNKYEEALAGRPRADVLGKRFFHEVAPCTQVTGLATMFDSAIQDETFRFEINFRFGHPHVTSPRDVHLELVSLRIADASFAALLVQDVSALRAVERTKDFLGRLLSHDMRSPLTAAIGNLEIAEQELMASQSTVGGTEELGHVRVALSRLRSMIEDFDQLTSLDGRVERTREPVDTGDLVRSVVQPKEALASAQETRLIVECEEAPTILADESLLHRAVDNLVENALRHGGAGNRIAVRCRAVDGEVVFEVEDRGPGVPAEHRANVFEAGWTSVKRGSANAAQQPHGNGLGLALVRMVAELYGGTVELVDPPAGGALFRLRLPLEVPTSG